MRSLILVAVLSVVLGTQSIALAESCKSYWTDGRPYYSSNFFCDDFDRDCTSPPPWPDHCTTDSTYDNSKLRSVWQPMQQHDLGQCPGTTMYVETTSTLLVDDPFGGRYPCQGAAHLGQQEVNLVPYIEAKFGSGKTVVNGGNTMPVYPNGAAGDVLNLIFTMNGGIAPNDHIQFDNGYMELGLDDNEGAPVDFIHIGWAESETCTSCYGWCNHINVPPGVESGVRISLPTIIQQYNPRVNPLGPTANPKCPPAMTNVRKALAVGALALLDNNPCHCEDTANQVPENGHLSYYDGLKWRILKSGDGYTTQGDFTLDAKRSEVQLFVKVSTVDILMQTATKGTSQAIGLPRLYTGPFNKLRAGVNHGCELQNSSTSYACIASGPGHDTCFRTGEFKCAGDGQFQDMKSSFVVFDLVWIRGGYSGTSTITGSCCLPDTTCQTTTQAQCTGTWGGDGSTCSTAVCCYTPWASADADGDVDQDDFGMFQACYTGSVTPETGLAGYCRCFDRGSGSTPVADGKIDDADFTAFQNCFSGPQVPWSLVVAPLCINP